jgi:hypothetical protein
LDKEQGAAKLEGIPVKKVISKVNVSRYVRGGKARRGKGGI